MFEKPLTRLFLFLMLILMYLYPQRYLVHLQLGP